MFVFRIFTSPNSGLGHLARMQVLANALEKNNQKTFFILDENAPKLESFLNGRATFNLDLPENSSEIEDAQAMLNLLKSKNIHPDWIIVDHYNLGKAWESRIQSEGFKVLAVDDLVREHSANAVVDARWRGEAAKKIYQPMVSDEADLLLGPDFLLLDKPESFDIPLKKYNVFRLLIGLGGGGDGLFLKAILDSILMQFKDTQTPLYIKVVLGPMLSNLDLLLNWALDLPEFIKLDWVNGKTNLDYEYQWCDFYLGAAGGTLYQIRALKKQALFFSMAQNQENNQNLLDDIGQYFFIPQLTVSETKDLANFIYTITQQQIRIKLLFGKSKITLDYQGVNRIADYLIDGVLPKDSVYMLRKHSSWQALANNYQVRPVEDEDINHYLFSRNHPANRQNMLDTTKIQPLSHYNWWFKTNRRSFLLAKEEEPKLYIWDQLNIFKNSEYLIGGWFVCDESTSHQEAMLALDWQLKKCKKDYPKATWIAVINRNNRYVKLMNDYFGFKEIDSTSRYIEVVNHYFPTATESEFYYVYK